MMVIYCHEFNNDVQVYYWTAEHIKILYIMQFVNDPDLNPASIQIVVDIVEQTCDTMITRIPKVVKLSLIQYLSFIFWVLKKEVKQTTLSSSVRKSNNFILNVWLLTTLANFSHVVRTDPFSFK